jgi:guanylate kinase
VTKSAEKLPGLIVVISSPSGTGKTTICHRLIKRHKDFIFSVSATTRPPRKKEKNGIDYYFLTDEQFNRMLKGNEFAEWANVFGYRYGTGKSELGKALKNNRVLLCDVDIQGGMSIKKKYKNAVSIFVIPPSLTELKRRLFKRRTESPSQKKLRLKTAIKELSFWKHYDYIVLNDDLKTATDEVDMIIAAERHKTGRLKNCGLWSRAQNKLLGL